MFFTHFLFTFSFPVGERVFSFGISVFKLQPRSWSRHQILSGLPSSEGSFGTFYSSSVSGNSSGGISESVLVSDQLARISLSSSSSLATSLKCLKISTSQGTNLDPIFYPFYGFLKSLTRLYSSAFNQSPTTNKIKS